MIFLIFLLFSSFAPFKIFREFELPAELTRISKLRDAVRLQRKQFLAAITNNTDVRNLEKYVSIELSNYERVVQDAASGGLILSVEDDFPIGTEKWSVMQAVFFASTVLTTIGEFTFYASLML